MRTAPAVLISRISSNNSNRHHNNRSTNARPTGPSGRRRIAARRTLISPREPAGL